MGPAANLTSDYSNRAFLFSVSMVDGDLFDKLAKVGQLLKSKAKPFGGIQVRNTRLRVTATGHTEEISRQLIVTGDFFQLPPVSKVGQPRFCFEASMWKECIDVTFNLTQVFRQKDQGTPIRLYLTSHHVLNQTQVLWIC